MNRAQLNQAFALARSDADLRTEDISVFDGFGLPDFEPVYVTIESVAALIRWQCRDIFGGGFDAEALDEIARLGRCRFHIIEESESAAA